MLRLRKHPNQKTLHKYFKYKSGNLYWKINHNSFKKNQIAGRLDGHGYWVIYFKGHTYSAHRLIWIFKKGPTKLFIDHKNEIKTDNKISNLREATKQQNEWHKPKKSHNTTGFRGVYKLSKKSPRQFWAYLTVNGKRRGLGMYFTAEEAAIAYNKAAKKLHGKFSHLNKVGKNV